MSGRRTFRVLAEGGHEFDVDYPSSTAPLTEVIEDQVADGKLQVLGVYTDDGDLEACTTLDGPAVPEVADEGGFPVPPTPTDPEGDGEGDGPVAPPRNASTQAWHDYAVSVGADPADLVDLGRDDLVERYAPDPEGEDD